MKKQIIGFIIFSFFIFACWGEANVYPQINNDLIFFQGDSTTGWAQIYDWVDNDWTNLGIMKGSEYNVLSGDSSIVRTSYDSQTGFFNIEAIGEAGFTQIYFTKNNKLIEHFPFCVTILRKNYLEMDPALKLGIIFSQNRNFLEVGHRYIMKIHFNSKIPRALFTGDLYLIEGKRIRPDGSEINFKLFKKFDEKKNQIVIYDFIIEDNMLEKGFHKIYLKLHFMGVEIDTWQYICFGEFTDRGDFFGAKIDGVLQDKWSDKALLFGMFPYEPYRDRKGSNGEILFRVGNEVKWGTPWDIYWNIITTSIGDMKPGEYDVSIYLSSTKITVSRSEVLKIVRGY